MNHQQNKRERRAFAAYMRSGDGGLFQKWLHYNWNRVKRVNLRRA